MSSNEREIRFIDSEYRVLFRIPDGGAINIIYPPGDGRGTLTRTCTFLDDCHTSIGGNVYHICEFAERMEQLGARYEPAPEKTKFAEGLPEYCFGKLEADGEIVRIVRGESGYYRIAPQPTIPLIELNASIGVCKAQADAMLFGSMFGWDKPGADPSRYDPDGIPSPVPKRRSSQMER